MLGTGEQTMSEIETKEVLKDIFNELDFDCVDATDCVSGERVVDWECIVNIFERYGITEEDLYSND
jgi:hypothetical protein